MKTAGLVASGLLLLTALVLGPFLLAGDRFTLFDCSLALLICLVPAGISVLVMLYAPPGQGVAAILSGSVIRMFFVMIGGFLKQLNDPGPAAQSFWMLLGLYYLVILAVETVYLVRIKAAG